MEHRFNYCDRNRLSLDSCIVSKPKLATLARLVVPTYSSTKVRNPFCTLAGLAFLGFSLQRAAPPARTIIPSRTSVYCMASVLAVRGTLFSHDNRDDRRHTQGSGTYSRCEIGGSVYSFQWFVHLISSLRRSVEGGCTTVPPSHCAAVEQRTKKYLYKAITNNTTAHAAGT